MTRRRTEKSKRRRNIQRIVMWLLFLALLWPFYILAGRALCYIALREIAELTNTKIRTGSVRFHSDGSVFIRKLSISPSDDQNSGDPIFRAEEVGVRFSPLSFLLLNPRLQVIDVNDFVFDARYNLDEDRWNLSALKMRPPKGSPDLMPRIRLKSGILQYSKASGGRFEVAVVLPLDAQLEADRDSREGCKFEITTAARASGSGQSTLTGSWTPGKVTLAGGLASVDVPEFEMAWIIDLMAAELMYGEDHEYSLKLRVGGLRSRRNPALARLALVEPASPGKSSPFASLQRFFDRYQPSGRLDINLDASGSFNRLSESTLTGNVVCQDIAVCYHKFQYAIEGIAGRVDFTGSSVDLRNLSGRHGDVRLFFNGWSRGFGPDWKYLIRITSDSVPLDNDLYDALSPRQQEFWSAFSPAGTTAVDYRFVRESPTDKHRTLILEPQRAEAVYCNFLYPLKNITGRLTFERDKVVFSDVVSRVNDCRITLNGEVMTRGVEKPTYDLTARVKNLPLDTTLQDALPDQHRELFRQFHPSGLADGWVRFSASEREPASFTADMSFEKASLNSEQFPLPITDISAKAVFSPDLIIIKEFTGRHNNGLLSLNGQIEPGGELKQPSYRLSIRFEDAELTDELFALLPDSTKKIVDEFKPQGKVSLVAELDKKSSSESRDCTVTVECLGNSISSPKLPHPLKDITGVFTVAGDVVRLGGLAAALDYGPLEPNDPAKVIVSGQVTLAENSFRSAVLDISANDILFDGPLAQVLPRRAQGVYDSQAVPGRFDLDFKGVRISRDQDGRNSYDFDGAVNLKGCGLKVSGSRIELDSALSAKGRYETGPGFTSCQAELRDGTLRIMGKTINSLNTKILYDTNESSWSTEHLVAEFYGGKLKGDLVIRQPAEQPGQYVLQAGFENADLQRFLADTTRAGATESDYTTGQMDGSLSLSARIGDISTRIGTCKLEIADMRAGKLSLLAQILNVMQLTAPSDFAFDKMLVDSYIRHNKLFVRRLDLAGRAHAFTGSGVLDLHNLDINLRLTARGKRRATDDPSVLGSLTEGLGQAVVRIDVTGNMHETRVTTETLPVIKETLQVFGSKPPASD